VTNKDRSNESIKRGGGCFGKKRAGTFSGKKRPKKEMKRGWGAGERD